MLTAGIVTLSGILLCLVFSYLWLYGGVMIREDNLFIRGVETLVAAAVLFYGLYRFYKGVRGWRRQSP